MLSKIITRLLFQIPDYDFDIDQLLHFFNFENISPLNDEKGREQGQIRGQNDENPNHKGEIWTKFGLDTSV